MAKKFFIKEAIKHPGALRRQLGVKDKIPRERLLSIISRLRAKAKKTKLTKPELTLLRRALLALRLRGFRKRGRAKA